MAIKQWRKGEMAHVVASCCSSWTMEEGKVTAEHKLGLGYSASIHEAGKNEHQVLTRVPSKHSTIMPILVPPPKSFFQFNSIIYPFSPLQ